MTLADEIRNMTDEELCDFLFWDMCGMCLNSDHERCGQTDVCKAGILLSLKQEIPGDERRCDSK